MNEVELQPIAVKLNGVRVRWYRDERYLQVSTGGEYGYKALAAIGPADLSRVAFVVAQNPRHMAGKLARKAGQPMIVHEALWSRVWTSKIVLGEIELLLAMANKPLVDGWTEIPEAMLRPLLSRALERSKVKGAMFQEDFVSFVLTQETARLRARLKQSGVRPEVADRYTMVSRSTACSVS